MAPSSVAHFLILNLVLGAARLGDSGSDSTRQGGELVSPGFFQMVNFLLAHDGRDVLNKEMSKRIEAAGLDPVIKVVDQPILHLFNLTGLSTMMVDHIAANSITTNGAVYNATLSITSKAEPLRATGYAGMMPHHIPLDMQVDGFRLTINEVRVEVTDADQMMTKCKVMDATISFEEVRFASANEGFANMLNHVAPHYQAEMLKWANGNVKMLIQNTIESMLPVSLLHFSSGAGQGGKSDTEADDVFDAEEPVDATVPDAEDGAGEEQNGSTDKDAEVDMAPAPKSSEELAGQRKSSEELAGQKKSSEELAGQQESSEESSEEPAGQQNTSEELADPQGQSPMEEELGAPDESDQSAFLP